MLKKLLITTAVSGLMLSSALAQAPSSSAPSAAPPAGSSASEPMKSDASKPSASDAMKSDASKPSASSASSASSSGASSGSATIASQKPDQLLASKFKGTDVLGANNEKIGDVSDLLFSKDGKIEAYIISVGGFLGVGAKEVALAPSSIQLTQDKDEFKLKVSMTKEQLAQAPNFEEHKAQRTTTGTGSASTGAGSPAPRNAPNAPAGSGMAPGSNAPAK
jgi:hypothetical protein